MMKTDAKLFYAIHTGSSTFRLWIPIDSKKYVSIDVTATNDALYTSRDKVDLVHETMLNKRFPSSMELDVTSPDYAHLMPEFLAVRERLDGIVMDHAMECGSCYENQLKHLQASDAAIELFNFAERVYFDVVQSDPIFEAMWNSPAGAMR